MMMDLVESNVAYKSVGFCVAVLLTKGQCEKPQKVRLQQIQIPTLS